jgi:transposase
MSTIAQIKPARVVVGVDTHLNTHTAVALDGIGRSLDCLTIGSNSSGYRRLLEWALSLGEVVSFAVEGTGSYGAGLARYLSSNGHQVIEVDRPNRKLRRGKGKSDPLDAEQAARQFLAGFANAQPKSQVAEAEMLRTLKVARNTAVKSSTQAKNSIKALVMTAPDQLRQQLNGLSNAELIRTCAGFRPAGCDCVEAATKTALRSLARRAKNLALEISQLSVEIDRLANQAAPELLELFGVGSEVASTLLVAVGDNVDRLTSESAFASLCGVSPIPASSGKTSRHRLNRAGHRQANAALHRIVIVRLRSHEKTKRYVERRTAEGKSKKEIIRCLKRYVAREVFAALRAMELRRIKPIETDA